MWEVEVYNGEYFLTWTNICNRKHQLYQGTGSFWGSFFPVWFMLDRCKNHLKYSCVKKRTHRHFHDFHLALYLCHYKTCFCGMHNQGAEHLAKSCYSKMSMKLNMIVVIFLKKKQKTPQKSQPNKQLDNIMTSNNTHCEWYMLKWWL